MAMMPKRVKHRKQQRGRMRGLATRGNTVSFGEFGLQSQDSAWITAKQLEAGRVAATHFLHREGRVYIRVFPDKPISKKPLEVRMGKGKGETEEWVAPIKPGTILFEIGGVDEPTAKAALRRVAHKMPVTCRMVYRRHGL
ncbi:MAG TPA: 50S ribosomal protein L16 [Phycisphaerae bacterium]|nr:50S ribosomal protein L16 [Phycisphaerae bacterium]HQL72849.1 50S ribosomal protein L16 [Phycisphaerae bacterium]